MHAGIKNTLFEGPYLIKSFSNLILYNYLIALKTNKPYTLIGKSKEKNKSSTTFHHFFVFLA